MGRLLRELNIQLYEMIIVQTLAFLYSVSKAVPGHI